MKRRARIAALGMMLVAALGLASIPASAQEPRTDPMALLMSGQYDELDRVMQAVQDGYRQGSLTDEQLLVAFRPFYRVSDPGQDEHFDAWIQRKPRSYVARLARGIHYKYVGVRGRGSDTLDKVPDANLWTRKEAYEKAAEDLSDSIDLDEKPLLSYHHLMDASGSLLLLTSNKALLGKAMAVDPGNLIVRRKFLNTRAIRWGGSLKEMRAFVAESRAAGLPDGHIRKLEAVITSEEGWVAYFRKRDYALAERLFTEVLAVDPDDITAAEFYISVLERQRKCPELIDAANRLLEREPENVLALSNRGLCYVRQEKFEQGVSDYRKAAELGHAWAEKELARLHWQGRLVPQDRTLALQLLRRAAERGDSDAQRELKRVTGERVVTKRSNWDALMPFGTLAIVLGGVGSLAARARRRSLGEGAERLLSHPLSLYVTGAACFGFFMSILIVSKMYPNRTETILTTSVFLAFAVAAVPMMMAYLFVRHEVTEDGLVYTRFNGSRGTLKWADVRRVSYSGFMKWVNVEKRSGEVARVSVKLLNFPVFARELLGHVPSSAIEPQAAAVLESARESAGAADWSDEDIEAQGVGRADRIALPGGTDIAQVALFSVDELPAGKSIDPAMIERLEAEGLAINIDTGADGGYLMHVYVDRPVPEGVRKYFPADGRKTARLRTKTGRIGFGGAESMCADFVPNSNIRTDARIPPGEYDATVWMTSYPDEMVAAAMSQSGGARDEMWLRIRSIVFMASAIAAFVAFSRGHYWVGGALLAFALTSGKVLYGRAGREESRRQRDEAALNFPSVVAHLVRREKLE